MQNLEGRMKIVGIFSLEDKKTKGVCVCVCVWKTVYEYICEKDKVPVPMYNWHTWKSANTNEIRAKFKGKTLKSFPTFTISRLF